MLQLQLQAVVDIGGGGVLTCRMGEGEEFRVGVAEMEGGRASQHCKRGGVGVFCYHGMLPRERRPTSGNSATVGDS